MRHLGAQEAADAIRATIERDRSTRLDPTNIHRLNFIKDVCKWLNLDPSIENVTHVDVVLREHGIALHEGLEFPKFVTCADGSACIVNSAAEEHDVLHPAASVEPSGELEKLGAEEDAARRAPVEEFFPAEAPVDPEPQPVPVDPEPPSKPKNKRPV